MISLCFFVVNISLFAPYYQTTHKRAVSKFIRYVDKMSGKLILFA